MAVVLLMSLLVNTLARPQYDRRRDDDAEERRLGNKRRPCRIGGKFKDAEGRTFFDWHYSYVNVNNNHNYNIDCAGGGGGGFGGGGKPLRPHGGGGYPQPGTYT